MSNEQGRPVHLTNGERELLGRLIEVELERLSAGGLPVDIRPVHEHSAAKFRKMRARQYRRLLAELRCPRLAEGQFVRPVEEDVMPAEPE
jgi:FixJ family two-component response regulator